MSSEAVAPNSAPRKKALLNAARSYRNSLNDQARDYLHARGFNDEAIQRFGFGYVANPAPEHQRARGMLAIPYLTPRNGVKAIRFRCIEDHVCKEVEHHAKYWGEAGTRTGMFNTRDLTAAGDTIGVCEGELDALTLSATIMPAVGIPGANNWQPFYSRMLSGFSKVILFADGDEAGEKLAHAFRKNLMSSGVVIICKSPLGTDCNEIYVKGGKEALAALLKVDEDE